MPANDDDNDGPRVYVDQLTAQRGAIGINIDTGSRRPAPRSTLRELGPFVGREADLAAIERALNDLTKPARIILHGDMGVGKTHLATHYGIVNCSRYAGGTFFIPFDADPALELANLISGESHNMPIVARAGLALAGLEKLTLLVYDNVQSEKDLNEWLPPPNLPAHVIVTTTYRSWGRVYKKRLIEALDDNDAHELIEQIAGKELAATYGETLESRSCGNAVQLKADANFLYYEAKHGRQPDIADALADDTVSSFERNFQRLTSDGQFAARVAALFNQARIPIDELATMLESATWDARRVEKAIDCISDRAFVDSGEGILRMHGLIAKFLRALSNPPLPAQLLQHHRTRFIEVASTLASAPSDAKLRAQVTAYPEDPAIWEAIGVAMNRLELQTVASALVEMGRSTEARPWFERAMNAAKSSTATVPSTN